MEFKCDAAGRAPSITRIAQALSNAWRQSLTLAVLSVGTAGSIGLLSLSPGTSFQRFFGPVNPLLAVSLVTVFGVVSLRFLHSRDGFEIYVGRAKSRDKSLRLADVAA
jgi:hypothetical protein